MTRLVRRTVALVVVVAIAWARGVPSATADAAREGAANEPVCPDGMALVGDVCVDRWEAAVETLDDRGEPSGLHPHERELRGQRVRAVSRPSVHPQAHVSQEEASAACAEAKKRLCTADEWRRACRGETPTTYPYGARFRSGVCNDEGVSPLRALHGTSYAHDYATMNDPRLDRVPGTVARTGEHARCTSGNGTFDMVGNLHEWTAGPPVFRGGYFLDTKTLGRGCDYATAGHGATYRDYSTGFRCCASPLR